jgi:hypothetical protein
VALNTYKGDPTIAVREYVHILMPKEIISYVELQLS